MESPDVNILVNAFHKDSESHALCYNWLENKINGSAILAISPLVLSGYLRIVTHPKIFTNPSSLKEAMAFCEIIRSSPSSVMIEPGEHHWEIFYNLCQKYNPQGNQIPDVWLAALAVEHNCHWITLDQEFSRYSGLRVALPR